MNDHLALARSALAAVGDGWKADSAEREYLDFKETPETALSPEQLAKRNIGNERKRFYMLLAETAICLANAGGGVIVIGVRDRAATRADAVRGVDRQVYDPEGLRLAVFERTKPAMTVEVYEEDVDGVTVLLIRVPRGTVVHATSEGVYKRRVGDQCRPVAGDEMRDLQAARGQYDWSAELTDYDPQHVSRSALAVAADYLRRAGRSELADLAEDDPAQFLSDTDLLFDGRLRRAAVLLYGRPECIRALVPDWGVILTSARSAGGEGTVRIGREQSAERAMVPLIDDIRTTMSALASAETIRVLGTEITLIDYPVEDVVRELVANAFAHRDWERPGIIEIRHSPDELVIVSPGGLLPTLHADRLLRETAQRNHTIAREISRLRLAEGAGLGFDRVWRALAALGKQPPTISPEPAFTVTVPGGQGDRTFARFLRGPAFPAPRMAEDLDVLLVLSVLRRRATVRAPQIAGFLQRDAEATQRALARMQDAALIEPTAGTKRYQFPSYRLTAPVRAALRSALGYRVDSIDSDDGKLVRHLKRHGRISNEDVRNYLDCDVATARNRLTRMRKKGWIDFAPDSPKRGPSVEYVATAAIDDIETS